jgi:hypothetical protein
MHGLHAREDNWSVARCNDRGGYLGNPSAPELQAGLTELPLYWQKLLAKFQQLMGLKLLEKGNTSDELDTMRVPGTKPEAWRMDVMGYEMSL